MSDGPGSDDAKPADPFEGDPSEAAFKSPDWSLPIFLAFVVGLVGVAFVLIEDPFGIYAQPIPAVVRKIDQVSTLKYGTTLDEILTMLPDVTAVATPGGASPANIAAPPGPELVVRNLDEKNPFARSRNDDPDQRNWRMLRYETADEVRLAVWIYLGRTQPYGRNQAVRFRENAEEIMLQERIDAANGDAYGPMTSAIAVLGFDDQNRLIARTQSLVADSRDDFYKML